MRVDMRVNDEKEKDIIDFLELSNNKSRLIKNALIFYKKAIDKNIVFDMTLEKEDAWDKIFDDGVPAGLFKDKKENVKELLKEELMD